MKKAVLCGLIVLLSQGTTLFADRLASLPDLKKPFFLSVDYEQFYISDEASVYIYSLKDYKLKKKFGREGEGPQEFKLNSSRQGVTVFPYKKFLIVNSTGKISFFSREGKFIKEMKTKSLVQGACFHPLNNGFVGMDLAINPQDQVIYTTINLYNTQLKKVKEIHKQKMAAKRGYFEFPMVPPAFCVADEKILITPEPGFVLDIFNNKGNKVTSIQREYKQLKVTEAYKESVHEYLKTNPASKAGYEAIKNMIKFCEYFPVIRFFQAGKKQIYIVTYLLKNEKYETYIYNMDGKFIKRVFLPIKYIDIQRRTPDTFHNNRFYQVIENNKTEQWELHATKIE